jgi:hypothetical protein
MRELQKGAGVNPANHSAHMILFMLFLLKIDTAGGSSVE